MWQVQRDQGRRFKAAGSAGRTNTTLFEGRRSGHSSSSFDDMMALGCRRHDAFARIQLSEGARSGALPSATEKNAPKLFSELLVKRKRVVGSLNLSPLFLEFLQGHGRFSSARPWGNPDVQHLSAGRSPAIFCRKGYVKTFRKLMELTAWEKYGHKSGNEKLQGLHGSIAATSRRPWMKRLDRIWAEFVRDRTERRWPTDF